jgi:hypothetical protein
VGKTSISKSYLPRVNNAGNEFKSGDSERTVKAQ